MDVPQVLYVPSAGTIASIAITDVPFTNGLLTPLQASVANPALGFSKFFANNSGQASLTDSVGNTVTLLDNPASQDEDMNGHQIIGLVGESFQADVVINTGPGSTTQNVVIGDGSVVGGGASNAIQLSGFGSVADAPNAVVIGSQLTATGQYCVCIGGAGVTSSGKAAVNIGGGDTGWTNPQNFSVAIGSDQSWGAGTDGIVIGHTAGLGAVNNAIALGSGAVNATGHSCLIGDPGIANIRPNNTASCDLGTSSAEFKDAWLSGGLRGPLSLGSNYSTYADTTCNNTLAETNISTSASSVGSLTLPAGQPLGMVFELNLCAVASSVAGDNLAIRFYANAGLLYTHNFTIPALASSLPITISAHVTIRNGNVHVCSVSNQNGTFAFVVSSAIVYDRTIAETWSVTAQWGANVNQLTCGQLYTKSFFRG